MKVDSEVKDLVNVTTLTPGDFFIQEGEVYMVISDSARNCIPYDMKCFSFNRELFVGFDDGEVVMPINTERIKIVIV